ncbi:helix-turn-helix transcriptional regulator [Kitasatospora sp. CM 4170]|uniref:Helix-turn-helix transcriptional regulator n=1 Tax=Kitasatospora aburaviensis TaxID=67265 RepID=A0ABW1ES41_9ACTN|nr:helix-turn-helix transcriptional regulator [Kitasatospora sp. CM 4170]WNM45746.1 helix-turn-helix transcriptional regulator [Kitasatospora sp. CM 4170]
MTVLDDLTAADAEPGRKEQKDRRRTELARFLKACRARVTPEDVGLPPGLRRRTPGLRREEVAQLAGVGVTWYTWLEQGRPINASEQVLAAVARALRLDGTEREHLFRLAGLSPDFLAEPEPPVLDPSTQVILDALAPLPAAVSNTRFDVLMYNRPYESLFGAARITTANGRFNSIWCTVLAPPCCNPFVNRAEALPRMVAVLRSAYGKHVGEPAWEEHVQRLSERSELFRELWERQEVAPPEIWLRVFKHPKVGALRLNASYLTMPGVPETYIVVYLPEGPQDRERIEQLAALPPGGWLDPCHDCGYPSGHGPRSGEAVEVGAAGAAGRPDKA